MNVLVAGAGGALGGHLVKRLVADGHVVRAVDKKPLDEWWQRQEPSEDLLEATVDLSLYEQARWAVEGAEWVFNLAADMGGIGFIGSHRADCLFSVLINANLLKAARNEGAQRFFYSSSACVYRAQSQSMPEDGYGLLIEDDAWPWDPEKGYGEEKLFSEQMCRYAREDWNLETRIARLHNVYGPYSTWMGGREKAPAAITRKVLEATLTGENEIEIWGDGKQTRSFLYVDDFVEGALRIMRSDYVDPVNLGSSEVVTIDELVGVAEQCAGLMPGSLKRNYDLSAPQGVRGRGSDNTLLEKVTGWEPSTSLVFGMQRLHDWMKKIMVNVR